MTVAAGASLGARARLLRRLVKTSQTPANSLNNQLIIHAAWSLLWPSRSPRGPVRNWSGLEYPPEADRLRVIETAVFEVLADSDP